MTNTQKLYLLLTILIFISLSCDSAIEPGKNLNPREFVWTVDTLELKDAGQIVMQNMYVSTLDDIWLCGYSDISFGELWHGYNNNWINMPRNEYSPYGLLNLTAIDGIRNTGEFWLAGNDYDFNTPRKNIPFVIHYDGSTWNFKYLPGTNQNVWDICQVNANEVYVVGDQGAIWYYNGGSWTYEKLDLDVSDGVNCQIKAIEYYRGKLHLVVSALDIQGSKYFHLTGRFGNWEVKNIHERKNFNIRWEFGVLGLYSSDWGKLYSYGWEFFVTDDYKWDEVTEILRRDNPVKGVAGFNENNLILLGTFTKPLHWNGTDLVEISDLPDHTEVSFEAIEIIDDTVIIVGAMSGKTLLFKGTQR